jgi:acyl-CoA thioesterase FadM
VAATWRPSDDLADEDGLVRTEYLWAALDCPGYFAVEQQAGLAVLGSLAVAQHRPVRAGETLIVTGWPIASEGRKHRVGTALHDSSGQLAAAAIATWVTLRPRSG